MTHKTWWETEGSAMRPFPNEDIEEFAKRITAIAWSNGEYVEREACAKVCDEKVDAEYATGKVDHNEMGWTQACSIAIRARGQE